MTQQKIPIAYPHTPDLYMGKAHAAPFVPYVDTRWSRTWRLFTDKEAYYVARAVATRRWCMNPRDLPVPDAHVMLIQFDTMEDAMRAVNELRPINARLKAIPNIGALVMGDQQNRFKQDVAHGITPTYLVVSTEDKHCFLVTDVVG